MNVFAFLLIISCALNCAEQVLDSFIRSFGVLNSLATLSETSVMENYLVHAWSEATREMPPSGDEAIAQMRLHLQAQVPEKQRALLEAWPALGSNDRTTLNEEMSRSGIVDQVFTRGPAFKQAR